MLHHVALEVGPDQIAAESRFWVLAGFREVPVPEALGGGYTWFERDGTQIHLLHADDPVIPARGHAAVAVAGFQTTFDALRAEGYDVEEGRQLWGERRAKLITPAGHLVEIMADPPPPVVE